MRTYVTGATGLVGSHVVERLLAEGHDVRTLVRPRADVTWLQTTGCTIVPGDIGDTVELLAESMAGCDTLVHAAALVGARTSRERYHDLNVRGTGVVMAAAVAAGVRRVVHVSSVAVYGNLRGPITEERWREQPIRPGAYYAASKRMAEEEAWRHDGADGMRVVTVRPSLIYGERDRHVAPRMDRLVRRRILPLPDRGMHSPPLVYAGNVARGIVAALTDPVAQGRAYNLAQDHTEPLVRIVREWAGLRGIPAPRVVNLPGRLLEGAARAADVLSRTVPGIDLPGLARPARLLRSDNPYDSSRARAELGWDPSVRLPEALRRTAAWLDESRTGTAGGSA